MRIVVEVSAAPMREMALFYRTTPWKCRALHCIVLLGGIVRENCQNMCQRFFTRETCTEAYNFPAIQLVMK